jgi:hypothetical protein
MTPSPEYYRQPSAETLVKAREWAGAELTEPILGGEPVGKYLGQLTILDGRVMAVLVHLDKHVLGAGKIIIYGTEQEECVFGQVGGEELLRAMKAKDNATLGRVGSFAKLGITTPEESDFNLQSVKYSPTGRTADMRHDCLRIERTIPEGERYARMSYPTITREVYHRSVTGLAEVFENNFSGFKLKPIVVAS